jgi:hypothetical protein
LRGEGAQGEDENGKTFNIQRPRKEAESRDGREEGEGGNDLKFGFEISKEGRMKET